MSFPKDTPSDLHSVGKTRLLSGTSANKLWIQTTRINTLHVQTLTKCLVLPTVETETFWTHPPITTQHKHDAHAKVTTWTLSPLTKLTKHDVCKQTDKKTANVSQIHFIKIRNVLPSRQSGGDRTLAKHQQN